MISTLNLIVKMRKIKGKKEVGGTSIRTHKPELTAKLLLYVESIKHELQSPQVARPKNV